MWVCTRDPKLAFLSKYVLHRLSILLFSLQYFTPASMYDILVPRTQTHWYTLISEQHHGLELALFAIHTLLSLAQSSNLLFRQYDAAPDTMNCFSSHHIEFAQCKEGGSSEGTRPQRGQKFRPTNECVWSPGYSFTVVNRREQRWPWQRRSGPLSLE